MGMPIDDVIGRSTWNPAREIKRRTGQPVCRGARGRCRTAPGARRFRIRRYQRRKTTRPSEADLRADGTRRKSCLRSQRHHPRGLGQARAGLQGAGRRQVGRNHRPRGSCAQVKGGSFLRRYPRNRPPTLRLLARDFLSCGPGS
jgi:hypothetical protein